MVAYVSSGDGRPACKLLYAPFTVTFCAIQIQKFLDGISDKAHLFSHNPLWRTIPICVGKRALSVGVLWPVERRAAVVWQSIGTADADARLSPSRQFAVVIGPTSRHPVHDSATNLTSLHETVTSLHSNTRTLAYITQCRRTSMIGQSHMNYHNYYTVITTKSTSWTTSNYCRYCCGYCCYYYFVDCIYFFSF